MAYFLRKIDIEKKFKELLKSLGDYGKQVEELKDLSGSVLEVLVCRNSTR